MQIHLDLILQICTKKIIPKTDSNKISPNIFCNITIPKDMKDWFNFISVFNTVGVLQIHLAKSKINDEAVMLDQPYEGSYSFRCSQTPDAFLGPVLIVVATVSGQHLIRTSN